ncbi:hypothetical protein [Saudi moumouvirus]|nr:hypothetical protein [Saudi moumouvirus]
MNTTKSQVITKNLKYSFSGNTVEVYSGDLKVGSVEINQKDPVCICICMIPERAVEDLNSWYRCCMNDCDDHDHMPDSVKFPDEMLYDLPAIKWYSRKDLGNSISDLWNCWEAIQQHF